MAHLKNNVVSVKSLGLCQCLFANFSNKHYNRYNKHMRKMSIQCWDSNPRPLEHESPQQCDRIWRFIGLWSTIQSQWQQLFYPKRPTLLGNFCKGVKIDHFSTEIFLGNLTDIWQFFLVTLLLTQPLDQGLPKFFKKWASFYSFLSFLPSTIQILFDKA